MDLFPTTKEEQNIIYEQLGTNEQKIKQDVKILEKWTSDQAHFPQTFQYDNFLEIVLMRNKCSVERTKARLEKYFTLKLKNKEFYELLSSSNFNLPSRFVGTIFPLPKLGPDQSRIFVGHYDCETDDKKFVMDHCLQYLLQLIELAYKYDRTVNITLVVDLEHFTFDLMKKFDWIRFPRFCKHALEAYSSLISGLHFLNIKHKSSITFLNLVKKLLKPKLAERIHIHRDVQSLQKVLPKEYLPEELGGDQPGYKKESYKFDKAVLDHKTFFEECIKYAVNENFREDFRESFRQLDID